MMTEFSQGFSYNHDKYDANFGISQKIIYMEKAFEE